VLGGLLALVLLAVGVAYALSELPAHAPLAIASDSATVAHGRRVAQTRGCTECHGANLGGRVLVDDPMFGRLTPPNLTAGAGGRGAQLTPADWERAVRHGLRGDGTSLLVMPAQEYNGISDEDMAALVAYARSVAPVNNGVPAPRLGPLARVLFAAGQLPAAPAELVNQRAPHRASVPVAATPEYGEYLATSCTGCHTTRFSGGPMNGPPGGLPAANITPDSATRIGRWSETEFIHALRTGRRPNGSMIGSTQMPIPMTRQMSDTELQAIYRHLRTLPPRSTAVDSGRVALTARRAV